MFASCGLVGNPHLTAKIIFLLPFQRQPSFAFPFCCAVAFVLFGWGVCFRIPPTSCFLGGVCVSESRIHLGLCPNDFVDGEHACEKWSVDGPNAHDVHQGVQLTIRPKF